MKAPNEICEEFAKREKELVAVILAREFNESSLLAFHSGMQDIEKELNLEFEIWKKKNKQDTSLTLTDHGLL